MSTPANVTTAFAALLSASWQALFHTTLVGSRSPGLFLTKQKGNPRPMLGPTLLRKNQRRDGLTTACEALCRWRHD